MRLLSVTLTPVNAGNLRTVWIEGYSRVRVSFTAGEVELLPGEEIDRYEVRFDGVTTPASGAGIATAGPLRAGENELVCTVYGKNGESASLTRTVTAYGYIPPSAAVEVLRCDGLGQRDSEGGFARVTVRGSWSEMDGQNSLTTRISYRLKTEEEYTEAGTVRGTGTALIPGELRSDRSYLFRFTVSDSVGNAKEYSRALPSEYWAMRFSSDGRGIAFGGGTAESGVFSLGTGMSLRLGSTALTEQKLAELLQPPQPAGIQMKLLWTNAAPTSNMAAQTIALGLEGYDGAVIQYKRAANNEIYACGYVPADGKLHTLIIRSTGTATMIARSFTVTETGITVSTGYSGTTAGQQYIIPVKIWGVKGIT